MRTDVSRGLVAVAVLAVLAALSVVGVTGPASATSNVVYEHTWAPPLALTSNYRACCPSVARFAEPPFSMKVSGHQAAALTVRMRTRWVDWKAHHDSPNIVQQGVFDAPPLFKLEIGQGLLASAHRAVCVLIGRNGRELAAVGPPIDVADGLWHTIVCHKWRDTATSSSARVDVDGVRGVPAVSVGALGSLASTAPVTLGGRSAVASSDSLDGYVRRLVYVVG